MQLHLDNLNRAIDSGSTVDIERATTAIKSILVDPRLQTETDVAFSRSIEPGSRQWGLDTLRRLASEADRFIANTLQDISAAGFDVPADMLTV